MSNEIWTSSPIHLSRRLAKRIPRCLNRGLFHGRAQPEVTEFDIQKAIKKRTYQPSPRNDLAEAARSALEQGFNAHEAAVRGIELVK